MEAGKGARDFRQPVEDRLLIRGMIFGGFKKCLYSGCRNSIPILNAGSPRFLKTTGRSQMAQAPRDVLRIHYAEEDNYLPDFIVETAGERYSAKSSAPARVDDPVVQKKAKAATLWCSRASTVSDKPWRYALSLTIRCRSIGRLAV